MAGSCADGLKGMNRGVLGGIAGSYDLHDPLSRRVKIEGLTLESGRRPGRELLFCSPEGVSKVCQRCLKGWSYELRLGHAGVAKEVSTKVTGCDPDGYIVGYHELPSGNYVLPRIDP